MSTRNFKDLTIKDNFMFQQVMKEESICRRFLEKRLEDEILNLKYGYDNARAEGRAEGEAKGCKEGRKEGEARGRIASAVERVAGEGF